MGKEFMLVNDLLIDFHRKLYHRIRASEILKYKTTSVTNLTVKMKSINLFIRSTLSHYR